VATPFLGEVRIFSFGFAPKGWAVCAGQLLPINQFQALFSLLGTQYGGDGATNFALPNLRGRIALHAGAALVQGQAFGEESHKLSVSEMPAHSHALQGSTNAANTPAPTGNVLATTGSALYAAGTAGGLVTLNPQSVTTTGSGVPHENRQPFLTLNVCIALVGIFPTRN
jgi:microcystin-dependent protein